MNQLEVHPPQDLGLHHSFDGIASISDQRTSALNLSFFYENLEQILLILDESPAFISYVDLSLRYQFVNSSYEEWFGMSPESIINKTIPEVLGEEYFQRYRPYIERALEGETVQFESSVIANKKNLHFQLKYVPFKTAGIQKGFLVLGFDITSRKNAELDQRLLAQLARDFASISDSKQIISLATEKLALHLGVNRSWLVDLDDDYKQAVVHADYARNLPSLKGCYNLDDFGTDMVQYWRHHKISCLEDVTTDPRTITASQEYLGIGIGAMISVPLYRAGKLVGALNVSSSSPRKWEEREKDLICSLGDYLWLSLENARLFKDLQNAVKSRDEFLNSCSHELKTPLTSMMLQFQLASKLIEKNDPVSYLPETIEHRVTLTNRQLERMSKLIDNMLDVSRIAAGKLSCEFFPLDLNPIVQKVVEKFMPQMRTLEIGLHLDLDPGIIIMGDSKRLDQALSNLISNAIKFGKSQPISIMLKKHEKSTSLSVSDQGIGIATKDQARVFRRFERGTSTSTVEGLGLGLFITWEIVRHHDGNLLMESELNKGTTFTLELPLLETELH